MQTTIHPNLVNTPNIIEAQDILKACVHCGFCTATCPTYQHFGDERDGPRGRIYLIKQLVETDEVTANTQKHLDRCLSCRSCETTCPSGVQYGRLLDIGRGIVEQKVERPLFDRVQRYALRKVLPYPKRFGFLLFWGQLLRPLLPAGIQAKVPVKESAKVLAKPLGNQTLGNQNRISNTPLSRTMIVLAGCAQSVTTPKTNAVATRVLAKLGIQLVEAPKAGCCGAVDYHLSAHYDGLNAMRRNIDAWWPLVEEGAEAIVMTASGCGTMVKDYGHLLDNDPVYAKKSKAISDITFDLSEVLDKEDLSLLAIDKKNSTNKTAYHCPCSLQHGQQLTGTVESVLSKVGVPLTKTKDKHLCCGSAGTYSILEGKTSQQLLANKLDALTIDQPEQIVTANVGCQLHLASKSSVPVKHWIELLD